MQNVALLAGGALGFYYLKRNFGPLPSWKGEIALITGGSGGIGMCIAEELLAEDCTVILWDINEQALLKAKSELVKKFSSMASKIHVYACDITNREKVYAVADVVRKEVGHVTILFNNAGVMPGKLLMEQSDDVIDRTLKVNTISLFWVTKAFLPNMLEKRRGHIINVASTAGVFAAPGLVEYCASKAGAIGFSRTLRVELQSLGHDIGVTCICPYAVATQLTVGWKHPAGLKSLKPEQVAKQIIFAAKHKDDVVFLPWNLNLAFLYSVLMPETYNYTASVSGLHGVTQSFKGRGADFILAKDTAPKL